MAPSYPQTMDIHAGRYSGTSSTANIDGTASQPAIAFGDDQDTGIYSPSNNKIGLSTGGAETVCVDSSGLDLASGKVIKINGSTVLTATSFTGNAASVTIADESSDTTCFPLFATAATGNLSPKSGSNLTFNSSSGLLTATSFAGASTTQSAGDNSTKLATTAYVDTATAALVDSAPSNLNTLNELAAALNDDADLANTVNTSIATKLPLAGGQMTGNITFSGSQTVDGRDVSADGTKLDGIAASATAVGGSSGVDFNDSVKARFGTGNDLEIYHNGTDSYIDNDTGDLLIRSDGDMFFYNKWDSEYFAKFIPNGAVELYYNNSLKFKTTASGIDCSDQFQCDGTIFGTGGVQINSDSTKLRLGAGEDLHIYHNGSNSYIQHFNTGNLYIMPTTGDVIIDNGSGELGRFTQGGDWELPDNGEYRCGTGDDLKIYHDGSHSYINNTGTGNLYLKDTGIVKVRTGTFGVDNADGTETMMQMSADGAVELFYNNSKKFETQNDGCQVSGHLRLASDGDTIRIGADGDLLIHHSSSNSYLENSTGNLILKDTSGSIYLQSTGIYIQDDTTNENIAKFISDGACELYYDNSKKLETKSDGLLSSGSITITGQNTTHTAGGLAIGYEGSHLHQIRTYGGNASNGGRLDLVTSRSDGSSSKTITLINNDGNMYVPDSQELQFGNGADLKIYHDGSNSRIHNGTGELIFRTGSNYVFYNSDGTEKHAKFITNGQVELYHDNVKVVETHANGIFLKGPEGGNASLYLYADEGDDDQDKWRILSTTGGELHLENKTSGSWEDSLHLIANGGAELYYDNAKKFETKSNGCNWYNNLDGGDGYGIRFGDDLDLQIYHDNSAGNNKIDFYNDLKLRPKGSEDGIVVEVDGPVKAWYDDAKKFETKSNGIKVWGSVEEISDITLKRNIRLIDNPLTKLKEIKGYTYQFKENGQCSVGVIAQEVEKVFPQLVHGVEGAKGVDYSGLVGALIESVNELNVTTSKLNTQQVNLTSDVSGVIDEDRIESKTKIQDGINKIKALNSYQVTLKEDSKIRDGFVSSDVKTIYGREETSLIPTLTAALSEAIQKIEALEAKVSALEAA